MMTSRFKNVTGTLKDENGFLSVIMTVFLMLPILYVIYLELTSAYTNITILEMVSNDVNADLNLISNFSALYSAYAIYNIKKNIFIKENKLAFYIILLGQMLQMYTATIVIMLFYVYKFVGIKQIRREIKELQWGKSYKALFFSIVVCLISLFVMIIRIKLMV